MLVQQTVKKFEHNSNSNIWGMVLRLKKSNGTFGPLSPLSPLNPMNPTSPYDENDEQTWKQRKMSPVALMSKWA